MALQRLKRIRSHVGLSRWLAEIDMTRPVAFLSRNQVADIPSPYAYTPSKMVYRWDRAGADVVYFETAHKVYDVFRVPPDMPRFATDVEAAAHHVLGE